MVMHGLVNQFPFLESEIFLLSSVGAVAFAGCFIIVYSLLGNKD